MKYSYILKMTGFCVITLILCWLSLPDAASGAQKIAGKSVLSEGEGSSFVIKDVRVDEKTVMRSSSEHFVLEWVGNEIVGEGDEIGPSLSGESTLPKVFSLSQNYPNPFNPTTTITIDIPGERGEKQPVNLMIYDIRGRHVKTLINSELEAGIHRIVWDGRNERGQRVSSGVYLYTMRGGSKTYTRKMVSVK
jgi:flagellar hook assembly protein FlgD